jgi:hypothetical protein
METNQDRSSNQPTRRSLSENPTKKKSMGSSRVQVPRGFLERQRMMDEFESDDGLGDFQPSAKIIRHSSKRPVIKSNDTTAAQDLHSIGEIRENQNVTVSKSSDDHLQQTSKQSHHQRAAVMSESIVERPFSQPKKISRFKMMKQAQLDIRDEKKGGFPSFDIPVGTLTRRGGKIEFDHVNAKGSLTTHAQGVVKNKTKSSLDNGNGRDGDSSSSPSEADKIVANMSQDEIIQSVQEIKSILSSDTIQFLKQRKHHQTKVTKGEDGKYRNKTTTRTTTTTNDKGQSNDLHTRQIEEKSASVVSEELVSKQQNSLQQQERNHSYKVLSNIQTEQELEEAFRKAMGDFDDVCGSIAEDKEESELFKATKLLRSTASRQRTLGAKTVCEILENRIRQLSEHADQDWYEDASTYPDVLPVSLRCLLDTLSPQNNVQLISYIVRAIHVLVILFCHPEHRVGLSITGTLEGNDANNVLQQDFMYDAVPISPGYQMYSREKACKIENTAVFGDGCYTTNASAASAKSDAKAFYNDPAWTLLSKMRFIPCISHILSALCRLRQKATCNDTPTISSNAIMSICGILSSLGIRSPGAAVAISQHKDLLPSLFTLTLEPDNSGDNSFVVDTTAAFPAMYLSCVLCAQSRTVAESLQSVMESVVYIVANDPENQQEFQLEQWCLIFWRKLLRYGIGISYLPTLLPISVKQLTCGDRTPFSLAAEYFSAFAVICQCVKVARHQSSCQSDSSNIILEDSVREILAMSGMWFSSHAQNCINFFAESFRSHSTRDHLKLASAKLRFLSSYIDASSPIDINGSTLVSSKNVNFVSIIHEDDFMLALDNIAKSKFLQNALFGSCSSPDSNITNVATWMRDEAACCAFIEAFFSSVSMLKAKICDASHSAQEVKADSGHNTGMESLVAKAYAHSTAYINKAAFSPHIDCFPKSRILWTNKAHLSLLDFHTMAIKILLLSSKITLKRPLKSVQSFSFSLIGKLQRGEEAKAVQLLNQDMFFTVIIKDGEMKKSFIGSSLRELIITELSENPSAQAQLDHSNKLEGHPGLMQERAGHFGLRSLRVENDVMLGNPDQLDESLTLPLGNEWAWKLISSPVARNREDKDTLTKISMVVKSILQFLLYVEESGMDFSTSLDTGSKMYYLLNSCLHPEAVISDKEYNEIFSKLFSLYQTSAAVDGDKTARSFIITCYEHSKYFQEYTRDRANYDTLSDLFFTDKVQAGDIGLSSKDFKAFDEFVDDLCAAFMDFGAQYNFFVYAIRFLLSPYMPVRVRNRTLENLKDILHLLTTECESKDKEKKELKKCLKYFYAGGLPFLDHSKRDHSSTLDILASVLKTGSFDLLQRQEGFFFLYAVGSLARNLASNAVKCECGVKSMKRRLSTLKKDVWAKILAIAIATIKEKCASADHLASIVLRKYVEDIPVCDLEFDEAVQNLRDLHYGQTSATSK